MKKILLTMMTALLLVGCSNDEEQQTITTINLSQSELTIKVGEEAILTVSYSPSELSTPSYLWESSDENIVSISNGKLQAKKVGEVTITVSIPESNLISSCKVTVFPIEPNSIKLSSNSESVEIGKEIKLTYKIDPENTTNKDVEWSTSNAKIATVTDGTITTLSDGECEITVKIKGTKTLDKCIVIVAPIKVSEIKLSENNKSIEKGESFTLEASILPKNATNIKYKWIASNENISISSDGLVTGCKTGTSYAIAETEDGEFRDTCEVTISPFKGGLYFDKSEYYIAIGHYANHSVNITVDYTPNLLWTSSNTAITISDNGQIYAKSVGNSIVTAKIKDKNIQAKCTVHAVNPADAVDVKANISKMKWESDGYAYITFKAIFWNITLNTIKLNSVILLNENDEILQTKQLSNSSSIIEDLFNPIKAKKTMTSADLDRYSQWKVVYQYSIGDNDYSKEMYIDAHSFARK